MQATPSPTTRMLEEIDYDELCERVDVAELPAAPGNAIAHIAPTMAQRPTPPADFSGILAPGLHPPVEPPLRARHPEGWWTTSFQAPALYAALLRNVLCFGGLPYRGHSSGHTLLVQDRLIVPDSYFVRNTVRSLPADLIANVGKTEPETLGKSFDSAGITTKPGLYYFAGAAWEHFGHFVLEGLSRWWLLALLPQPLRAELRFVIYNEHPLKTWQLELLEGLGVGADRLIYLAEPMRFERLIVPSIAYNLHRAAAHAQRDTWERIGRVFDRGEGPKRVYLSRSRYGPNRALTNEAEVERRFEACGFTIVHPQELSIAEQIASIRHAQLIAGSAGGAMYLSAFARRGGRKLIISPRNFTFRDDQLISHLRGGQIAYILCTQEANHENPRMADYEVEMDVLDTAINRWVADSS
jgi:hypothetical protein